MAGLMQWESFFRLASFLTIFAALAAFELWSPRLERAEMAGALKSRRWLTNLSLLVVSSALLRVVFPAAAVGAALWAETAGWGALRLAGVDPLLGGVIAFVVLDFAVWLEHVASHKIPLLWRFHRTHHADQGFDVTTGLRFHPVEILLSMGWKAGIVVLVGAPLLSVLAFEIVLNAGSMFSHANVRLKSGLDRRLRTMIVTPDMHRVHHSSWKRETDSNYGFNLAVWDRLFGTYVAEPRLGQTGIELGLEAYRSEGPDRLGWTLLLPFRKS